MSTYQYFISADDISIGRCGNSSFDEIMNRKLGLSAEREYNIQTRFTLPRSHQVASGAALKSVRFIYRIVSGTLNSMVPSISQYTYRQSAKQSGVITATTSTTPTLTTTTNVNIMSIDVDDVVYENSDETRAINWLLNVALETQTEVSMLVYGICITYAKQNHDNVAMLVDADTTLNAINSGIGFNVDLSSDVTLTLPDIAANITATTFNIRMITTGNLTITSNDTIEGLGISGSTLTATPRVNDTIVLVAAGDRWRITNGTFTPTVV